MVNFDDSMLNGDDWGRASFVIRNTSGVLVVTSRTRLVDTTISLWQNFMLPEKVCHMLHDFCR